MRTITIGIDLAKSAFSTYTVDAGGRVLHSARICGARRSRCGWLTSAERRVAGLR